MKHVIACTPIKMYETADIPKGEGIEVPCIKCDKKVWLLDAAIASVKKFSQETPVILCLNCVAEMIEKENKPASIVLVEK